jgi:hypothetical protein
MHSLVMLIATWNQSSAPRVAACTGRVWSGSGQPCGRYRRDGGDLGWARSPGAIAASPMGQVTCQVTETRRTHEDDNTRKQSIPHPRGAPDS